MSESYFPNLSELNRLAELASTHVLHGDSRASVPDLSGDLLSLEDDLPLRLSTYLLRVVEHQEELVMAMRREITEYRRVYTTAQKLMVYRAQVDEMIERGETAPFE